MGPQATTILLVLIGLASLAVLGRLFQKHLDGRPLLEYEPRRPVPWNFLAPLIILTPAIWAVASGFFGQPSDEVSAEDTGALVALLYAAPRDACPPVQAAAAIAAVAGYEACQQASVTQQFLPNTLAQAIASLFLTATSYILLIAVFRATPRDLGLPASRRQFFLDMGLGATAFLAALLPVYLIQAALSFTFQPKEIHPLIEHLHTEHSPAMMLAAAFAAVIAAPLFEETAFRLVLQGWLERVEDERIPPDQLSLALQSLYVDDSKMPPPRRPGLIADIPHGWLPILITATLFSLAHLGHGVAPISLFILGLALGYLYQRTHRIVPSITCHALFNLLSLGTLWLVLNS